MRVMPIFSVQNSIVIDFTKNEDFIFKDSNIWLIPTSGKYRKECTYSGKRTAILFSRNNI